MTARILIVDDNKKNVALLQRILETRYYNILIALNGKDALDIIYKEKIDIILLDIMLPVIDGFAICRHLKSDYKTIHIPIIVISALSDIEDKIYGLSIGADDFIVKPVKAQKILNRVELLLRLKSSYDELNFRLENNIFNDLYKEHFIACVKEEYNTKVALLHNDYFSSSALYKIISNYFTEVRLFDVTSGELLDIITKYNVDIILINIEEFNELLKICSKIKSIASMRYVPIIAIILDEKYFFSKPNEVIINDYAVYPYHYNELISRIKTQIKITKYRNILLNSVNYSMNNVYIDSLTGCYNRIYLEFINKSIASKCNKDCCVGMAILDIDFFKDINDKYGHLIGDQVLQKLSLNIRKILRITDIFVRFGGEEFIILINNTNEHYMKDIANRILYYFRKNSVFDEEQVQIFITLSIGIKTFKHYEIKSIDHMIADVDKLLYKAKFSGRNKIIGE